MKKLSDNLHDLKLLNYSDIVDLFIDVNDLYPEFLKFREKCNDDYCDDLDVWIGAGFKALIGSAVGCSLCTVATDQVSGIFEGTLLFLLSLSFGTFLFHSVDNEDNSFTDGFNYGTKEILKKRINDDFEELAISFCEYVILNGSDPKNFNWREEFSKVFKKYSSFYKIDDSEIFVDKVFDMMNDDNFVKDNINAIVRHTASNYDIMKGKKVRSIRK